MAESIRQELEQLERVGRVSARGQRQVHVDFGFSAMIDSQPPQAVAQPVGSVAADLDDAFSRLKSRVDPE